MTEVTPEETPEVGGIETVDETPEAQVPELGTLDVVEDEEFVFGEYDFKTDPATGLQI